MFKSRTSLFPSILPSNEQQQHKKVTKTFIIIIHHKEGTNFLEFSNEFSQTKNSSCSRSVIHHFIFLFVISCSPYSLISILLMSFVHLLECVIRCNVIFHMTQTRKTEQFVFKEKKLFKCLREGKNISI